MSGKKGRSGGHNRKPTALKVIEGTARPDRINPHEPRVVPCLPEPPPWLGPSERVHYQRVGQLLERMGILSEADAEALALLAECYTEYLGLCQQVEERGATYDVMDREGNTTIRKNPAAAMKADAWRRLTALMLSFGMTPASRATVSVLPSDGNVDTGRKWR